MSKIQDKICKIRDLMISKDYDKFKFYKMHLLGLKEDIHRQISKKAQNYKYELDFTAQDLRELGEDIRKCLNRWETATNPEKNIKSLLKNMQNNTVNLTEFFDRVLPVIRASTENMQAITELLNIVEYHAVYLYMLEEASNDKFALELTERF